MNRNEIISEAAMTFGLARVGTAGQDEALQPKVLEHAGWDRIFADRASGATGSRTALDELLEQLEG